MLFNNQAPSTNNQPPKGMVFLIRADASYKIGIGHVMRCIALGQMLLDDGHQVIFLTQTDDEKINDRLLKEEFGLINFIEADILKDANYTVKIGQDIGADWIVTDGYKFKTEYQKIIKSSGFKLMCIDDVCDCHYVSNIVLNQNLNAENIYKYSCEDYTRLLLGFKYVLLRREFRRNNAERTVSEKCTKLLITFGGSDQKNLTYEVLKYLENNKENSFHIRLIFGTNSNDSAEIENIKRYGKDKIEYLYDVGNIIEHMDWCDLAITAGGSTVWELIATKTPFILIPVAENQINVAKEVVSKLKACVFYNSDELSEVFNYSLEYKYRSDIIANMKVLKEDNDFINNDLISVFNNYKLRKAALEDMKNIYILSNEKAVRENSIKQSNITWEEHKKWFERKINDENCVYYVIYSFENNFIGQVRFEIDENKHAVVSVSIAEEYRGKKMSHIILKRSCEKLFMDKKNIYEVSAYIEQKNIPSIRMVEKAGFVFFENVIINSKEYIQLKLVTVKN